MLITRLTSLERQCWANAQYSRRECLDIMGIPHEVSGEVLDEKVLKIFRKIGCDISPDHTEVCHRVGRTTDTVIVRFSKRKDCQRVCSVKKGLKKLTMADLELPRNNKLFINRSLCHITKCWRLKARNFIASIKEIVFFLFLVIRSRSRSMKIARHCR